MKDSKGYQYQKDHLYGFSDNISFDNSTITTLEDIQRDRFITPLGKFTYITEITNKIGRIDKPKIKLEANCYYLCNFQGHDGVYKFNQGKWYDSYNGMLIEPKDIYIISKMVKSDGS
jgi:hypothetical protein